MISLARHQFPAVIIRHAVWLYVRFTLSYRNVEDLLAERGLMSPIDRVVIGRATIRIQLSEVSEENDSARILTLSWTRPSPYRKREIIQGANDAETTAARCPPTRVRSCSKPFGTPIAGWTNFFPIPA